MGIRVGYGKIGRSMPLDLKNCGSLGGDVEMTAVIGELARAQPDDTFVLIGRNSGEDPEAVGLPDNVENPWVKGGHWDKRRREFMADLRKRRGPDAGGLTISEQQEICQMFDELTLDTFLGLDAIVMWVGQHGTSNFPIPRIGNRGELTKPQDWSLHYASFIFRGINAWRDVDPFNREEIYLNSDPRNNHKMRDLKWPLFHPVIAQYNFNNNLKHERHTQDSELAKKQFFEYLEHYRSNATHTSHEPFAQPYWRHYEMLGYEAGACVWKSIVKNAYERLEINSLVPGTPFGNLIQYNEDWINRSHFGIFINETRTYVKNARLDVLKKWVLPLKPAWIHGTWSKPSLQDLGINITPLSADKYFPQMSSTRCTFTTPASGTGWATAKPWEAFAAGTVCFFHPAYDDQDNILRDARPVLHQWLRVTSPEQLARRVQHLNANYDDWLWIVRAQREHFDDAVKERRYLQAIQRRLPGEWSA